MVMLDAARGTPVPTVARWPLGLGIVATIVANVTYDSGCGPVSFCERAQWCYVVCVARIHRGDVTARHERKIQMDLTATAAVEGSSPETPQPRSALV